MNKTGGDNTISGRAQVAVFAKAPERGCVKTRIAATLGEATALEVHIELVERGLRRLCGDPGYSCGLWVDRRNTATNAWADQYDLVLYQQVGADLGERMHHAFATMLAQADSALLVGTDCPTLDATYLRQAFDFLHDPDVDVVLGPAEDGGYGLIGMSRPQPMLFENITWGSSEVLAQTIAQIEQLDLRYMLLPLIWDVDDEQDWRRYQCLLQSP